MNEEQVIYTVFSVVVILALIFDLGLISKKGKIMTLKDALWQSIFWVGLSLAFAVFLYIYNEHGDGKEDTLLFLSAYVLEKSLSIDNIFVFVIIFGFFKIKPSEYSRVLTWGILMAVVFRIIFIAVGSALVAQFGWILYLFGIFLLYTGIHMFKPGDEETFKPEESFAYKLIKRFLPTTNEPANGRFTIRRNGKLLFTTLSVVVIMLGFIDIVFAVDSIPAVFSVIPDPEKKMLIYSSNIFAVLGLRSLFFLLQGAADKFDYLQQGIAIVLIFIGIKMLLPLLQVIGVTEQKIHIPIWISLLVILVCIAGSVIYSIYNDPERKSPEANQVENQ